jgi:hypothetical protein
VLGLASAAMIGTSLDAQRAVAPGMVRWRTKVRASTSDTACGDELAMGLVPWPRIAKPSKAQN